MAYFDWHTHCGVGGRVAVQSKIEYGGALGIEKAEMEHRDG